MMNIFTQKHLPRIWNTKESGVIEFLIYKEEDTYVGVCLTFNIVEEGSDPNEVKKQLEEAAKLHLTVVRDKRLSDELLNRHAPKEYWDKYFAFQELLTTQKEVAPTDVFETLVKRYPNSFALV